MQTLVCRKETELLQEWARLPLYIASMVQRANTILPKLLEYNDQATD